jgi:hypothetical protein
MGRGQGRSETLVVFLLSEDCTRCCQRRGSHLAPAEQERPRGAQRLALTKPLNAPRPLESSSHLR